MSALLNSKKETVLKAGDLVRMNVSDVDRGKTDNPTITLIVLEVVKRKSDQPAIYRLGSKRGPLKRFWSRSCLSRVKTVSAKVMGLEGVLLEWKGMPSVSVHEAVQIDSSVGGQGMVRCDCQGKCDTKRCKCFKAGRKCNSRCH